MRYTALRELYNTYIFGGQLLWMLRGCNKVLDLGCGGNSLLVRSGITRRLRVTGVDICQTYIDYHNLMMNYTECFCADITKIKFGYDEFDAVVCMDVIEHIRKEDVLESGLLDNMKRWAGRVIITVPNGFVDHTDCDDNEYQKHLSGWSVRELKEYGYKVRGLSGWKVLRDNNSQLRFCFPYLFWAALSVASGLVTYYIPELSWHLLGTYRRNE